MIGDFMNRLELIKTLNKMLLNEMPMYQPQADTFSNDIHSQRDLLRSCKMNYFQQKLLKGVLLM